MDIVPYSQRLKLLEYIARLKYQLAEWLIVELNVSVPTENMSSTTVATLLHNLFKDNDGLVLECNSTNVLMLIQWGKKNSPQKLANQISYHLPSEVCDTKIFPPTKEGLQKIAVTIAGSTSQGNSLYTQRVLRNQKIFLIADDDMYMRTLAKTGLKEIGTVVEIATGNDVTEAYKKHNPDMVLLDIHLPGLSGQEILRQLTDLDPKAYVVMLSADSSPENVRWTHQHGAKGFLAKPFGKSKLLEYAEACPTII